MSDREHNLDPRQRELIAVLAHELRSPIGALLGFEELLSEGIYGTVDDQARDGLARMRHAARQLLQLVDGMTDLALHQHGGAPPEITIVNAARLVRAAVDAQRPDAETRSTTLELQEPHDLGSLRTDPERAGRALQLTIAAGIKTTHGGHIRLAARRDDHALTLELSGSALSPERDEPEHGTRLTGAGLRIAMARATVRPLHGSITLVSAGAGSTAVVRLPVRAD